jgi:hypothetical protein
MIAEYLKSLDGIVPLGIVSLVISILFFAAVIWRTLRLSPASLRELEQLPLDAGDRSTEHSDEGTP